MPEFTWTSDVDLPDDVELPPSTHLTRNEMCAFFRGYVIAMLWANVTWGTDTGDAPEGYSNSDITLTHDQLVELSVDAIDFAVGQQDLLVRYAEARSQGMSMLILGAWEHAGHDFALTRNGHGAGFWDRGLGDLGDELTQASKPYSTLNIDAVIENDELTTYIQ